MDRSFFLPIAVAAGVHSLLFISGTPNDTPHKAPLTIKTSPPIEVVFPPIEPDVIEPERSDEKASPEPPPPQSPELISINVDPSAITRTVDWKDLVPIPGAPDATSISSDWPHATGPSTGAVSGLFSRLSLDNKPAARFQPAPVYPQDLKSTGEDGEVTVTFSVNINGEVFDATVNRASHTRFGEEALRAIKRWRFEPGIKNNKRVAFRMMQTFSFALSK
jgi:periplasmic protein TonB